MRVVVEADAELLAGRATVGQEARPEGRIDPGARDHFGAERRRARIQHLDLPADLAGLYQPPFDEQFANGCLHDLIVAGRLGGRQAQIGVVVVVVGFVRMHDSNSLQPCLENLNAQSVFRRPGIVRP